MLLFDIREDDGHQGWVDHINLELAIGEAGRAYLEWFGLVCSPRWWARFDRGEMPVQVRRGSSLKWACILIPSYQMR